MECPEGGGLGEYEMEHIELFRLIILTHSPNYENLGVIMIHTYFTVANYNSRMARSTFLLVLKLTDFPLLSFYGKYSAVLEGFIIVIETSKDHNLVPDWEHTKITPGLGSVGCGLNLRPL